MSSPGNVTKYAIDASAVNKYAPASTRSTRKRDLLNPTIKIPAVIRQLSANIDSEIGTNASMRGKETRANGITAQNVRNDAMQTANARRFAAAGAGVVTINTFDANASGCFDSGGLKMAGSPVSGTHRAFAGVSDPGSIVGDSGAQSGRGTDPRRSAGTWQLSTRWLSDALSESRSFRVCPSCAITISSGSAKKASNASAGMVFLRLITPC